MKRIFYIVIALLICGNSFSQTPLSYMFRKPTAVNATTWKFSSVAPGVDAIVSIIGSKNATLDRIDDSSVYAYAWQPFIRFTSTMSNASDSSYVTFNISFQNNSNASDSVQNKLAMTVIDCDGSNSIRELIKVSLPATATVITGSQLSEWADASLLNIVSGTANYSNIDTTIYAAMTQVNFTNIASYTMRIGALGQVTGNSVRQTSFYFKPFSAFSQALPVNLLSFNAKLLTYANAKLSWSTTAEENIDRFEVCRSSDGHNFYPIGNVYANDNGNDVLNYSYTDFNISGTEVFYRLKMIDNAGNYKFSNIFMVKLSNVTLTSTIAVFPNPTSDFVNVQLNTVPESDINVQIVDAYGKKVHDFINPEITSNNSMMFDIRNLENGIYFINVINDGGSLTTSKFIKR